MLSKVIMSVSGVLGVEVRSMKRYENDCITFYASRDLLALQSALVNTKLKY